MPFLRKIASLEPVSRLRYRFEVLRRMEGVHERECPLCGHRGMFRAHGLPPRFDACCPACGSLERHRLLGCYLLDQSESLLAGRRVLHFAPEPCIAQALQSAPLAAYVTADLHEPAVDEQLNIEKIDKPSNSFDLVLCSHVLEHVDDRQALSELHRILSPGGTAILMVPIVEAWTRTYEDEDIRTHRERELHFNQRDHLRFYGRDFRSRVKETGFETLSEFTAHGELAARYGLTRGETVFTARKPGSPVSA
jgi:SAM-dependent methyltransferase